MGAHYENNVKKREVIEGLEATTRQYHPVGKCEIIRICFKTRGGTAVKLNDTNHIAVVRMTVVNFDSDEGTRSRHWQNPQTSVELQ